MLEACGKAAGAIRSELGWVVQYAVRCRLCCALTTAVAAPSSYFFSADALQSHVDTRRKKEKDT